MPVAAVAFHILCYSSFSYYLDNIITPYVDVTDKVSKVPLVSESRIKNLTDSDCMSYKDISSATLDRDTEIDMKEVELNEVDPEKQLMMSERPGLRP